MKKNLAILIYSLGSGGAEKVVSLLMEELKFKYNITLILMNDNIFYTIPSDVELVYLDESDIFESGIKKFFKLPLLACKYKKICKNKNIQFSLSFMTRPNYINIFAKIFGMKSRVIISERAMPTLQHKEGIQGFLNIKLIKFLYPRADIITANSVGNSNDLKNNFNCSNVVTINNLFNIKRINELSKKNVFLKKNKFTFITIGRLDKGKNHKLLLHVMKYIDAKLLIIGEGELRSELEKQIENSNLEEKVFLLGNKKNPYKYLAYADCFVFSSLYEGFPNVLVEALICELPVISSDCQSGPREILSKDTFDFELDDDIKLCEYGILYKVNNQKSLLKAMQKMMLETNILINYKKKSLERIKEFSTENIINKWINNAIF